jgi:hypothetical protein
MMRFVLVVGLFGKLMGVPARYLLHGGLSDLAPISGAKGTGLRPANQQE